MNILYTLNSGSFGGMERHVVDLADGMTRKGHLVFVWCLEGPLADLLRHRGVNVFTKEIKYVFDLKYILQLIRFIKSNKIEIVHAHELKAVANSIFAAYLAKAPVRISHTHTPISQWRINFVKKAVDILVDSIVVNLFSTKEIALTRSRKKIKIKEGILPVKLLVTKSSNAIDVNLFKNHCEFKEKYRKEIFEAHSIKSESTIWGYLARLTEEKGHIVLLDAFKRFLSESTDKVHILFLAGGGKLKNRLTKYISDNNLTENVVITGRYKDEDLPKFYMVFDYFIHPGLAEGFGISLLEAMVSKIPVIASDLEVFREVAGDEIVYFKKGDSIDLAQKMKYILDNYDESKINNAYNIAQNYSLENFVNEYEQIYQKFLDSKLV